MNSKLLAIDAADTPRQFNRMTSFRAGFSNGNDHQQFETRDVIQREIERERISLEILAEEMARRRVFENEVRTELIIARQMATSNGGRFSLQAGHSNIYEPRLVNRQPIGLEERIIMAIDEKNRLSVPPFQRNGGSVMIEEIDTPISEDRKKEVFRCDTRGLTASPFKRCGNAVRIYNNLSQLPEANKKEVIVLGNPNGETLSGTKRKSTSLVGEESNEPHSDSSKKKMKGEWSCAICQVSATSECSLNYHLQGKKHQTKEANLIAEITGSNFGLGVLPKKPTVKPVKLALKTVNPRFRVEKMPKTKKEINIIPSTSTASSSVYVSNITKKEDVDRYDKSDKFKFWCEMCQVGTHSEKVMNAHKVGKKHVRLHRKGKVESNEKKTKTGIVEMVSAEGITFKDVNEIVSV